MSCALRFWKTRTRSFPSGIITYTSMCRNPQYPRSRHGTRKHSAQNPEREDKTKADLPGANLTFSKAEGPAVSTKGRALDHIGFDVNNLEAFCKKLEAAGIKLERPITKNANGVGIAFISDPWGTYIELNERPGAVYIQTTSRD